MSTTDAIQKNIATIRNTFQLGQQAATAMPEPGHCWTLLEALPPEFRSVAYEGASMEIALSDLSRDKTLTNWLLFKEGSGKNHSTQVHIGLGWALAQERLAPFPFLELSEPLSSFRILDGMGYYDGIFRRKETLRNPEGPTEIPLPYLQAYDMGLGRSLWYNCAADLSRLPELINAFARTRHADLWRGVGVACTYVGGCNATDLLELQALGANVSGQLAAGAALVARARIQAGLLTPDTELACHILCGCSAMEANQHTQRAEVMDAAENRFGRWMKKMEEAFVNTKFE